MTTDVVHGNLKAHRGSNGYAAQFVVAGALFNESHFTNAEDFTAALVERGMNASDARETIERLEREGSISIPAKGTATRRGTR